MAHPTLKEIVEVINWRREAFNETPITFPLTAADAEEIADYIDSRMSPENLFQDGMRPYAEAMRVRNWLQAGINQLARYCLARAMAIPKTYDAVPHI